MKKGKVQQRQEHYKKEPNVNAKSKKYIINQEFIMWVSQILNAEEEKVRDATVISAESVKTENTKTKTGE